jgi:hypothetical protein
MIDSSLHPSLLPLVWFHARQLFWMDLWPVMVGFLTIFCYQIYTRIGGMGGRSKPLVFLLSSAASALSLFGWATMVRSMRMIPLYACGVGLANLLASQIYAVTLPRHPRWRVRIPRVVWRSDAEAVKRFRERLSHDHMISHEELSQRTMV